MKILSRVNLSTQEEFEEWIEGLNFSIQRNPYHPSLIGIKYNLVDSDVYYNVASGFWNTSNYCIAIELYNNGILISNGTSVDSVYYVAIAPETLNDSWVWETSLSHYTSGNENDGGNLFVKKNIPNSGLSLSYDSIKLEQYYDLSTEEITPNKYYAIIMPYRNLQWLYYYNGPHGVTHYDRLSTHIPYFGSGYSDGVGQMVEVAINEKTFLILFRGWEGGYLDGYEESGVNHNTYCGAKMSVALRLS